MNENISIAQKLGCDKYALDNCILVKESVESVNAIVREYFELQVRSNCKISDYIDSKSASWKEVNRQQEIRSKRPNKSLPPVVWAVPFWQYLNHSWTILPLSSTENSIAFAFASLLNTETITFHDSDHASVSEFKVFRNDQLIEDYLFGFECGEVTKEYWDINIENFEFYDNWLNHEHHFKSSVRLVKESAIRLAVLERRHDRDDRGFLDACLKFYNAYIPTLEETPYHYDDERNADFQKWDSMVERMNMMIIPSDWKYPDSKVPDRVT